MESGKPTSFALLSDQPFKRDNDPLGFQEIAESLTHLVVDSRESTPLTLGIEGGWGAGKSTLMGYLATRLPLATPTRVVWFNAWTAPEGSALEGVIKSVMDALDPNILRRALRHRQLLSWSRLVVTFGLSWLGLGNIVNEAWSRVASDPKARDELRDLLSEAIAHWRSADIRDRSGLRNRLRLHPAEKHRDRLLALFIDDLDRCSPGNAFQLFEAIKLYLDVPGLVCVVGFDSDVISDAILQEKHYRAEVTGRHYLEKIIQLSFRLPSPSDAESDELIALSLDQSGTRHLFAESERSLLAERTRRNPRRVKRFVNSFVMEYGLNAQWDNDPDRLMRVLMLEVYFPDFYNVFVTSEQDRVAEFFDFDSARRALLRGQLAESDWEALDRSFVSLGRPAADRTAEPPSLLQSLEEADASGPFQGLYLRLAREGDFRNILEGLGDAADRLRVRQKVTDRRPRPRVSETDPDQPATSRARGSVFISYRRVDATYAQVIHDALTRRFGSDRVFIDAQIQPGANWREAIQGAIAGAGMILVVIGPTWAEDPGELVVQEISEALNRSVRILPVLVGGASFPQTIPPVVARLGDFQAFALIDTDKSLSQLADVVAYAIGV